MFGNREQLIAVAGGPDCKASQVPPRSYILHLSEGLVIEASPSGARGKSYAFYPANKGKYLKEDVAGPDGHLSRRVRQDARRLALQVASARDHTVVGGE